MSALPIIWTFRRCPYAIRARLAIDAAEIEVEYREITLRDKPAPMLRASPKGTVPVCITGNGTLIDESLDIMRWALDHADSEKWSPQNESEIAALERWIHANDIVFKPLLDRYKYAERHPERTRQQHLAACRPHFESLNKRLEEAPFLIADRMTLADAALLPFVRQFHRVDESAIAAWELRDVLRWLNNFLNSPRFERVMQKRPLWQA